MGDSKPCVPVLLRQKAVPVRVKLNVTLCFAEFPLLMTFDYRTFSDTHSSEASIWHHEEGITLALCQVGTE